MYNDESGLSHFYIRIRGIILLPFNFSKFSIKHARGLQDTFNVSSQAIINESDRSNRALVLLRAQM